MTKTRSGARKAEKDGKDASNPSQPNYCAGGKGGPVAGLFQKKHEHVHDGQKPTGITKLPATSKASAQLHPLFLRFKTATDGYRTGAEISLREDLKSIHDELIARLGGMDINGKELKIEGLPSKSEIEKLKAERAKFVKPFSEDTIDTEFTKADGTIVISAQPLGKTMAHFEKLTRETQAKVEPLFQELKEVDAEIDCILAGLGEDDATKKANADFEKAVKKLKADAAQALQQTLDDVANARQEDKNLSTESKKKLEEFLKSW